MRITAIALLTVFLLSSTVLASELERDVKYRFEGKVDVISIVENEETKAVVKVDGEGEVVYTGEVAATYADIVQNHRVDMASKGHYFKPITLTTGIKHGESIAAVRLQPEKDFSAMLNERVSVIVEHYIEFPTISVEREARVDQGTYKHYFSFYNPDGITFYELVKVIGRAYIEDSVVFKPFKPTEE